MSLATTRHMTPGGNDFRQRFTLTFVPGTERRYKEIYCLTCSKKILETYDELAYVSDVDDVSLPVSGKPSLIGLHCQGSCRNWYEVKLIPGVFEVDVTKLFFLDTQKKYREVHCHLCKELFCTITTGFVYGLRDPTARLLSEDGFVPTFCPGRGCSHEFEITTSQV